MDVIKSKHPNVWALNYFSLYNYPECPTKAVQLEFTVNTIMDVSQRLSVIVVEGGIVSVILQHCLL